MHVHAQSLESQIVLKGSKEAAILSCFSREAAGTLSLCLMFLNNTLVLSCLHSPILGVICWLPLMVDDDFSSLILCLSGNSQLWLNLYQNLRQSVQVIFVPC